MKQKNFLSVFLGFWGVFFIVFTVVLSFRSIHEPARILSVSEEAKQLLIQIATIPNISFAFKRAKKWFGLKNRTLLNTLAKKGYKIAFIHFPTYLVDLKASFQSEKSIDWTQLMEVPYLVLDGIGEENVTPYSRDEILLTILSYRLLNNLPTFFTSFYGFKDLQKVYTIKKGDELKAKTLILKMKALCKEITLDE